MSFLVLSLGWNYIIPGRCPWISLFSQDFDRQCRWRNFWLQIVFSWVFIPIFSFLGCLLLWAFWLVKKERKKKIRVKLMASLSPVTNISGKPKYNFQWPPQVLLSNEGQNYQNHLIIERLKRLDVMGNMNSELRKALSRSPRIFNISVQSLAI